MGIEIWAAMIGLAIFAPAVWLYNRLVADRNLVRQSYPDIDVQLKRRADLVPQLVGAADRVDARDENHGAPQPPSMPPAPAPPRTTETESPVSPRAARALYVKGVSNVSQRH